jgi:hypothetical protein
MRILQRLFVKEIGVFILYEIIPRMASWIISAIGEVS